MGVWVSGRRWTGLGSGRSPVATLLQCSAPLCFVSLLLGTCLRIRPSVVGSSSGSERSMSD